MISLLPIAFGAAVGLPLGLSCAAGIYALELRKVVVAVTPLRSFDRVLLETYNTAAILVTDDDGNIYEVSTLSMRGFKR